MIRQSGIVYTVYPPEICLETPRDSGSSSNQLVWRGVAEDGECDAYRCQILSHIPSFSILNSASGFVVAEEYAGRETTPFIESVKDHRSKDAVERASHCCVEVCHEGRRKERVDMLDCGEGGGWSEREYSARAGGLYDGRQAHILWRSFRIPTPTHDLQHRRHRSPLPLLAHLVALVTGAIMSHWITRRYTNRARTHARFKLNSFLLVRDRRWRSHTSFKPTAMATSFNIA